MQRSPAGTSVDRTGDRWTKIMDSRIGCGQREAASMRYRLGSAAQAEFHHAEEYAYRPEERRLDHRGLEKMEALADPTH